MSRRLLSAGLCAALLMGGCTGNQANPVQQKSIADVPPAGGDGGVATSAGTAAGAEPAAGAFHPSQLPRTPEGLAATAAAYAQLVEQIEPRPLGAALNEEPPAPAPVEHPATQAAVNPDLSVLKWLTDDDYHLTLGPAQEGHEAPAAESDTPAVTSQSAAIITIAGPPELVAAPVPAPKAAPAASQHAADALEEQLAARLRENPRDLSIHLDYQLLQMVQGKPVPQLEKVAGLESEDRELLAALLDAISNFRSNVRGGKNLLLAQKVQPLVEMQERLREKNLRVSTLALCRQVGGFGLYDKLGVDRIDPMRSQEIIVYCEVENFSSRYQSEQQVWETTLSKEITIHDETGRQIWIDRRQSTRDTCRTRRRDFSLAKRTTLPAMKPGRYTLTVSIQDDPAQRVSELSLPFVVASAETASATR